jgi:phage N-6-adenine-methyltransferase
LNNVVTLKRSGKLYRCIGAMPGAPKKRCKEQFFRLQDESTYRCVTCGADYGGAEFEEQLPPRNDWRTPSALWEKLNVEYHFNIDAAADEFNTKRSVFFDGKTPETDALIRSWDVFDGKSRVWCNPPYQPKGSVETWLQRGLNQAALGVFSVFLVPMASSVAWFNDLVVPVAQWHTFRGRISFEDPLASNADDERNSPKQDNLLVIFDPFSEIVGHAAVRDARTGARLWTRPDLLR